MFKMKPYFKRPVLVMHTLRLDVDTLAALKRAARRYGCGVSTLAREILAQELARLDALKKKSG
jgi:hypothetical protein